MHRSWLRRRRHRSGWRRTATVAADPLVVPDPVRPTAQLVPTETSSDGLAVETHVLARLLGVKLLTLEGVVLISPAQVSRDGVPENGVSHTPSPPRLSEGTARAAGPGLGEVSKLLDECTRELRALDTRRLKRD